MINNDVLFVLLFWGVWLLIPLVTDGFSSLWHMIIAIWSFYRFKLASLPASDLPRVSIVIPAYNEESNIGRCLVSLKAQTYPQYLMEIVVVDDGSQDKTVDSILEQIGPANGSSAYLRTNSFIAASEIFGGTINVVRRKRGSLWENGKPAAINAALKLISGDIVVAIDSDIVLEPDAIEQAIRAFMADDKLIAATGHLIVDPYLVNETGKNGNVLVDKNGLPVPKQLTLSQRFLTACQFIEYATAFHLGRRSEGMVDTLFTVSGACAVYRRSVFNQFDGYRGRTVSEDTDMTLMLHQIPGSHVGYLSNMRVHLAPVLSWATLYSQRTRWQRGALEVAAVHTTYHSQRHSKQFFWRVALPMRLQVDHTLALPRLAWTLMIFMMPLFGYSWNTIGSALSLLMVFYVVINVMRVFTSYLFSMPPEKVLIREYLRYIPFLPLYNTFLFWVRMSALMRTLTEDATWTVQSPLLQNLENGNLQRRLIHIATSFLNLFS